MMTRAQKKASLLHFELDEHSGDAYYAPIHLRGSQDVRDLRPRRLRRLSIAPCRSSMAAPELACCARRLRRCEELQRAMFDLARGIGADLSRTGVRGRFLPLDLIDGDLPDIPAALRVNDHQDLRRHLCGLARDPLPVSVKRPSCQIGRDSDPQRRAIAQQGRAHAGRQDVQFTLRTASRASGRGR
jgi:hypothetical protein